MLSLLLPPSLSRSLHLYVMGVLHLVGNRVLWVLVVEVRFWGRLEAFVG